MQTGTSTVPEFLSNSVGSGSASVQSTTTHVAGCALLDRWPDQAGLHNGRRGGGERAGILCTPQRAGGEQPLLRCWLIQGNGVQQGMGRCLSWCGARSAVGALSQAWRWRLQWTGWGKLRSQRGQGSQRGQVCVPEGTFWYVPQLGALYQGSPQLWYTLLCAACEAANGPLMLLITSIILFLNLTCLTRLSDALMSRNCCQSHCCNNLPLIHCNMR